MSNKKVFVISNTLFRDDDLEIMEKIEIWNSIIKPKDIVYICGNFAIEPIIFIKLLKLLNGEKHFILGEFDTFIKSFESQENLIIESDIIVLDEYKTVLSFWPLRNWPLKNYKYSHIYGFDSDLVEPDNLTGSCAVNSKFGNKPINLDLYVEILNKKL